MSNLMTGIAQNNFIIIGRAGIDLFTDPGVRVEDAESMTVDLGGSSANIGVGISKLGGRGTLVTRVSDDSVGSYCVNRLKHYGVETKYITKVSGEFRNSLAVYESRLDDHRNVIYRNGAADFQMDDGDVSAVDYSAYGALITAGTVLAAEPSRSATFAAFKLAKSAGLPIVFDVDYRPYSWPSAEVAADVLSRAAAECDMIVGNDDEFGFMAGDYNQGLSKAKSLSENGVEIVVYKMGHKGAITFHKGQEIRTGIYTVEALKPVGAGDSFMAGIMTSLAAGCDLEAAILRGSACASITVSRPGCAPALPDLPMLETFLAEHPGPSHP